MIVDCHTHIWTSSEQLGAGAKDCLVRQCGKAELPAAEGAHSASAGRIQKTLVLGFCSAELGASADNDTIADYVSRNSGSMIGVAAVDPTRGGAVAAASQLLDRGEFRALTISPALQNFHPADSRAMALYELAQRRGAPVFFDQGTHFPAAARMEYARPFLLDEIAREFPQLAMVVCTMGHPWPQECIALIGKNPRVFADLSGLIRREWALYNVLVLAQQFHVMDKVLFGSDFPFSTAPEAIETLYRMHQITQGINLPTVPREALRGIVERDTLASLGIARAGEAPLPVKDDEES